MASGFIQRWKGKANFDPGALWVGGLPLFGGGALQSLSLSTVQNSVINSYGVTAISATSGIVVVRLQKPAFANIEKTIQLTTVSSGIFITASTDGSVTINGSSINTTIKSTLAGTISLMATSTANWAITAIYPATLGFVTLSTST